MPLRSTTYCCPHQDDPGNQDGHLGHQARGSRGDRKISRRAGNRRLRPLRPTKKRGISPVIREMPPGLTGKRTPETITSSLAAPSARPAALARYLRACPARARKIVDPKGWQIDRPIGRFHRPRLIGGILKKKSGWSRGRFASSVRPRRAVPSAAARPFRQTAVQRAARRADA